MKVLTLNLKDTYIENNPSNRTKAPAKSLNMHIWEIGALNQLFTRGSYTELNIQKDWVVWDKSAFFVISPSCTPRSICLNIGFW